MRRTVALLTTAGQRVLLVDLVDGEPTSFAQRGVRAAAPWGRPVPWAIGRAGVALLAGDAQGEHAP